MAKKYIISSDCSVSCDEPDMNEMAQINGNDNRLVESGLWFEQKKKGVAIRKSSIGPDGYLAAHRSPGIVCIQVICGSGETRILSEDGSCLQSIPLSSGDLLVFEDGMPLHDYQAGKEGLSYIAISM